MGLGNKSNTLIDLLSVQNGGNGTYFMEVTTAHSGQDFRHVLVITDAVFTVITGANGSNIHSDQNFGSAATATLTGTTIADGDDVTIGSKTYTFQDTLTDVDGNVHVGASDSDSLDNLIDATKLGS